ncbi:MAG: formate acetyltransferase, partial [Candidatus Bathyarchaeota archaeon]|nr:formate acetyltransferase [Candidatus Bathyarchaeota archaeon]
MTDPPQTFREACQWLGFFQAAAKMYNGSGEWGQLDELLRPYYERDTAAGILSDEEAIFHIACLLLIETAYIQIGGPDAAGNDVTSPVSFLILEAVHRLKVPANIAIRVHDRMDPSLLRTGIEILFEDKMGFPKFAGDKGVNDGFVKNGYPIDLARQRIYSGCHWFGIPGREYTLNDCVKINFAAVFDFALREMMVDRAVIPSTEELWRLFEKHLRRAVKVVAEGLDFHLEHMHEVFPELYLDLFCYGPLEKGIDASHPFGVEFYNMCVDGAAIATVADSFASAEQRIDKEGRLTWHELLQYLDTDFEDAEDIRLMLRNIPRYGRGGTRADWWAVRIAQTFTRLVKEKPTPRGLNMIPGLFSWAGMISMGHAVGATPNGRHAHTPISQGANPNPGFIEGTSAPTALAVAVASVQPGYGNSAPLQLDMDPILVRGEGGLDKVEALIRGHFALGGTLINMNVISKQQIVEAHKDPPKYPNLIVRVTGFSAYFASLSKELRQLIVDRLLTEDQ